jgi:hypothetical protein
VIAGGADVIARFSLEQRADFAVISRKWREVSSACRKPFAGR